MRPRVKKTGRQIAIEWALALVLVGIMVTPFYIWWGSVIAHSGSSL